MVNNVFRMATDKKGQKLQDLHNPLQSLPHRKHQSEKRKAAFHFEIWKASISKLAAWSNQLHCAHAVGGEGSEERAQPKNGL